MKRCIRYVKVSMRYWSSTNRMSSRQNQSPICKIYFPTKLVTIKSFTPHEERHIPPVQESQSMCTRNKCTINPDGTTLCHRKHLRWANEVESPLAKRNFGHRNNIGPTKLCDLMFYIGKTFCQRCANIPDKRWQNIVPTHFLMSSLEIMWDK